MGRRAHEDIARRLEEAVGEGAMQVVSSAVYLGVNIGRANPEIAWRVVCAKIQACGVQSFHAQPCWVFAAGVAAVGRFAPRGGGGAGERDGSAGARRYL